MHFILFGILALRLRILLDAIQSSHEITDWICLNGFLHQRNSAGYFPADSAGYYDRTGKLKERESSRIVQVK